METIRVLVVDDDEISRLVVGRALEDVGHCVTYAVDGVSALGVLRKSVFDLVVTDLAMPEINGLRLIREMEDQGLDVPIIAISGQNAEQLQLAEDYGAKAILYKPIDRQELLATVERINREANQFWNHMWV